MPPIIRSATTERSNPTEFRSDIAKMSHAKKNCGFGKATIRSFVTLIWGQAVSNSLEDAGRSSSLARSARDLFLGRRSVDTAQ